MKGHAQFTLEDRARAIDEIRQEIQGRLPKGPFEFAEDLTFADVKPEEDDTPVVQRLKRAIQRDARYATASGPYIRKFGLSQAIRSVYDGGRQLIDGGVR